MRGRKKGKREGGKDKRKTRIKWEDYRGTPVSEMFDLVWFWPLKPRVRPIVSLSQCCNPPTAVEREVKKEKRRGDIGRSHS